MKLTGHRTLKWSLASSQCGLDDAPCRSPCALKSRGAPCSCRAVAAWPAAWSGLPYPLLSVRRDTSTCCGAAAAPPARFHIFLVWGLCSSLTVWAWPILFDVRGASDPWVTLCGSLVSSLASPCGQHVVTRLRIHAACARSADMVTEGGTWAVLLCFLYVLHSSIIAFVDHPPTPLCGFGPLLIFLSFLLRCFLRGCHGVLCPCLDTQG